MSILTLNRVKSHRITMIFFFLTFHLHLKFLRYTFCFFLIFFSFLLFVFRLHVKFFLCKICTWKWMMRQLHGIIMFLLFSFASNKILEANEHNHFYLLLLKRKEKRDAFKRSHQGWCAMRTLVILRWAMMLVRVRSQHAHIQMFMLSFLGCSSSSSSHLIDYCNIKTPQ